MNLIDLVKAHLDGSARPADTKALLDILDRALRSNDNGCAEARKLIAVGVMFRSNKDKERAEDLRDYASTVKCDSATARAMDRFIALGLLAPKFAEQHIVTVARLEAERDAAIAARNDLERRNQELVGERDEARDWVRRLTATDRVLTCVYCGEAYPPGSPTHGADVLTTHIRTCAKHPMRVTEAELSDERRRHTETASALSRAEKRIEELSAECAARAKFAADRACEAILREHRRHGCTCLDQETLDNLAATGPVIMPPCPVHHGGER